MTTLRTAAILLSVLVLAHAKPHEDVHEDHHDHEGHHGHGQQKRAASCEIDPSLPCECTNPFLGTNNFHLGDAKLNCKHAKACYVADQSGCSDSGPARGGGRCQSKEACPTEEKAVTTGTTPKTATTTTCKGGNKICNCLNNSDSCSKCEVSCMADCNDLTSDGSKCYSELACKPSLLFEKVC